MTVSLCEEAQLLLYNTTQKSMSRGVCVSEALPLRQQ